MGRDEPYRYRVLGLVLETSRMIPGLIPTASSQQSDVSVSFEGLPTWFGGRLLAGCHPTVIQELAYLRVAVYRTTAGTYWHFQRTDDTEYLVGNAGRDVWISWRDPVTFAEVCPDLFAPVFSLLLQFRGRTPLHASVVTIDGRAIAFIGPGGAGKSTTAAKFAQLGYAVLSEDVLNVLSEGKEFNALPGYPVLHLWPQAAAMFRGLADSPAYQMRGEDSVRIDLQADARRSEISPSPIAAIYVLKPRMKDHAAPYIEPLEPRAAFLELLANTLGPPLNAEARARSFAFVARVAADVPLRKVVPHSEPDRLERMCELIVDDVRTTQRSPFPVNGTLFLDP